jgi:hypothetical protein
MGLREILLNATESTRLESDKTIEGKHLKIKEGDTFNSTLCSLIDSEYRPLFNGSSLDGESYFMPSLLKRSAIGLMHSRLNLDLGSVYRFKVTKVEDRKIGDINVTYYAEPTAIVSDSINTVEYVHAGDNIQRSKVQASLDISILMRARNDPYFRTLLTSKNYPPAFMLPKYITDHWKSAQDSVIRYYVLRGNPIGYKPKKGDIFNAIVMAFQGNQDEFRLFQFREHGFLGFAKREADLHEVAHVPTLPYHELKVKLVFPFEVTAVFYRHGKEHIFFARPLELDFKQEPFADPIANLVYNMTHIHKV